MVGAQVSSEGRGGGVKSGKEGMRGVIMMGDLITCNIRCPMVLTGFRMNCVFLNRLATVLWFVLPPRTAGTAADVRPAEC